MRPRKNLKKERIVESPVTPTHNATQNWTRPLHIKCTTPSKNITESKNTPTPPEIANCKSQIANRKTNKLFSIRSGARVPLVLRHLQYDRHTSERNLQLQRQAGRVRGRREEEGRGERQERNQAAEAHGAGERAKRASIVTEECEATSERAKRASSTSSCD